MTGGEVGATCQGASISLYLATPNDGWVMHVDAAGPYSVKVRFGRGELESRITAQCEDGKPVGEIEDDDSGDSSSGQETEPAMRMVSA